MITFTVEVANTVIKLPLGDTGLVTEFDIAKMPASVLSMALVNGFMGALNNISRGKDEDGKPLSDDVWAAARQKKVDAWMAGDWASRSGGGERAMTALKEAFVDERKAATGATQAQVERTIKELVKARFGEKESATFARFMDALALQLAERDEGVGEGKAKPEHVAEKRAAIEAKYQGLADEAAKARAKAKAKIDLTDIAL